MSLTRLLARRYLLSRRKGFISLISWFSLLGIMLGVATLILVTSLMNGIRAEMLNNFIGVDGHIALYHASGTISDYDALMARVTPSLPANSIVIPRIQGQVMVSGADGTARGAQIIGLRDEDIRRKPLLHHALSGNIKDGIVLGSRLAETLHAESGDAVTLISPQGRATAFGSVPRIKAYPMTATMTLGMHALDSSLILMPYEQALTYFAMTRKGEHPASSLEITLPDLEQAQTIAKQLEHDLGREYRAFAWQDIHQSVFAALNVQRNVMVIILALIVLVAAFNIISSLVMLVKDKSSDIAILRTMGMSKRAVMGLFILTGMSIGVAGTIIGAILGILAAARIDALKRGVETLTGQEVLVDQLYFLSSLPTKTDAIDVLVIIGAALCISLIATLYPAYKAASTQPAEALRHG